MVSVLSARTGRAPDLSSLTGLPVSVWHLTPSLHCVCSPSYKPIWHNPSRCRFVSCLCRISPRLPLFNATVHWDFRGTWCLHFRLLWVSAEWVRHSMLPPSLLQAGCQVSAFPAPLSQPPRIFLLSFFRNVLDISCVFCCLCGFIPLFLFGVLEESKGK